MSVPNGIGAAESRRIVSIVLTVQEARALSHAAELVRDVFADAHLRADENNLATAHLRLLSALERDERFDHATGGSRR